MAADWMVCEYQVPQSFPSCCPVERMVFGRLAFGWLVALGLCCHWLRIPQLWLKSKGGGLMIAAGLVQTDSPIDSRVIRACTVRGCWFAVRGVWCVGALASRTAPIGAIIRRTE
jgi:hypothetical protein